LFNPLSRLVWVSPSGDPVFRVGVSEDEVGTSRTRPQLFPREHRIITALNDGAKTWPSEDKLKQWLAFFARHRVGYSMNT